MDEKYKIPTLPIDNVEHPDEWSAEPVPVDDVLASKLTNLCPGIHPVYADYYTKPIRSENPFSEFMPKELYIDNVHVASIVPDILYNYLDSQIELHITDPKIDLTKYLDKTKRHFKIELINGGTEEFGGYIDDMEGQASFVKMIVKLGASV